MNFLKLLLLIKIAIRFLLLFAVAFKGEKRMTSIAVAIVERAINIGGSNTEKKHHRMNKIDIENEAKRIKSVGSNREKSIIATAILEKSIFGRVSILFLLI